MVVFRISDFPTLDGQGGKLFGGRFNFKGTPIIYTSESVALAYYEISISRGSPSEFRLNSITFPNSLPIKEILTNDLPDLLAVNG